MRLRALVLLVSCGVCFAGPAPSADDILKAARQALGLKIETVHTLFIAASSDRGSSSSDVSLSFELPGKYLRETRPVSFNGMSDVAGSARPTFATSGALAPPVTVQCVDGDDVWMALRAAPGAQRPQPPAPLDDSRKLSLSSQFSRYLLAFLLSTRPDFPIEFAYIGQTPSPTGTADVIEGKGPDDFLVRLFFDTKTHRPLMMAYESANGLVQVWLDRYKPESGVAMPHRLTTVVNGDSTEVFKVKKVRINPAFPEDKFEDTLKTN